ncbi:MAG TPA: cation-translocating P-type ATPase [Saprospiraceae bacterium]|nr:cation-translocating P-type ATPase [Saprospiraceae bacterium]
MDVSHQGLNSDQVNALQAKHGFNELPQEKKKSLLGVAVEVVKEPMFILLIGCASLYTIMGDIKEGLIMLSTVFLMVGISLYQNYRSEKAMDALRKLSSPRVSVLRNDNWTILAGRELVPGDIVKISEGDRLAADLEILESNSLEVDESMLTGEAFAVKKDKEGDMVLYSGTLLVKGRAIAKVAFTGVAARIGSIALALQAPAESKTSLQKEMAQFVRQIGIIAVFLCLLIVGVFYWIRGDFLSALLNGLAAAMAILPEEFPVVFTIFLALGAWRLSRINVLTRQPSSIESLGAATVLCSDKTGTITQNKMQVAMVSKGPLSDPEKGGNISDYEIIHWAAMASPPDTADPMEHAFFRALEKQDMDLLTKATLIKEYALTNEVLAMTRIIKDEAGRVLAACKGAPETIVSLCKLTDDVKDAIFEEVATMAAAGCRVLAVANAEVKIDFLPETQKELPFTFLGLVGLEDPIRPEVPAAINLCKKAGIRVIMITGDHALTANAIGKKIGLSTEIILSGAEMAELTDAELTTMLHQCNIFARIQPEQKLRLVHLLKAQGEVVAMTGDGVNDAPALKAANIGIAMGNKGTDVAREAAKMVLLDDNFASIVTGIRLGRRIYDNLQKAMSYILAIHIPIIGLTLTPAFWGTMPLLLLPLHIILMELIIDPVCSIAFEFEQEERGIMSHPPRKNNVSFFGGRQLLSSFLHGFLLFIITLVTFLISFKEGHSEEQARMIAFSTLLIGNLFLIFSKLSKTRTVIEYIVSLNLTIIIIGLLVGTLLMALAFVPFLQHLLRLQWPGWQHYGVALASALIMLAILELIKLFHLKSQNL